MSSQSSARLLLAKGSPSHTSAHAALASILTHLVQIQRLRYLEACTGSMHNLPCDQFSKILLLLLLPTSIDLWAFWQLQAFLRTSTVHRPLHVCWGYQHETSSSLAAPSVKALVMSCCCLHTARAHSEQA